MKTKKVTFKSAYLIIISVFTIDFISTFIGLNIFPTGMFIETNPVARYFFSLGWYGWAIQYCLMLIAVYLMVLFAFWIRKYDKRYGKTNLHPILIIFVTVAVDSYAIINNIMLMAQAV